MTEIKKRYLLLFFVILIAVALRFIQLNNVPAGFHQDEVSQAYNAFSIGKAGYDRYREYFPILFRSFGSYQPPVYTYLSTIPILIFGNTVFAARFLSAFAGVIIVLLTYLITVNLTNEKYKYKLGLLSAFIVGVSPWAIHFSRRVVEGNVGLCFFLAAFLLFTLSLRKIKLFPLAMLLLGISTQAYYSERVISVLFIPAFLFVFRDIFLKYKKIVLFGLALFGLTQLPHVWILASGAFARRFDQVTYFNNDPGDLPKIVYLTKEFVRHYLIYLSPSSLFADTGSDLARVSPDLGVFFSWFFVPFLVGINFLARKIRGNFLKLFLVLLSMSLIPASLTGDVFYPLRTLEFLWCISIVVAIGMMVIYDFIKNRVIKIFIFGTLIFYSLISFYISYFILFQYENTEYVGVSYTKLVDILKSYDDKKIVIDSARDFAIGLRIAYLRGYDPDKLAKTLRPQLTNGYYSSEVSTSEVYLVDNIEVRNIDWGLDECSRDTILVGDELAISEAQAKDHKLTKVFDVETIDKKIVIVGYSTNPGNHCKE